MSALLPITGMLVVAAITPGPNNFLVLRAASRGGVRRAVGSILGIVSGGLALLFVVAAGASAAFATEPRLRTIVAIAGGAYLSWLGVRLVAATRTIPDRPVDSTAGSPSVASMFVFQFLNPKAWVMVLAAASTTPIVPWWQLAAVFVAIPMSCLIVWAGLGSALSRHLARRTTAIWFDRIMGTLLVVCAVVTGAGT